MAKSDRPSDYVYPKKRDKKYKWRKITVYTPKEFSPEMFPDDGVPLTYKMVCSILHIKPNTLARKIQEKKIKTLGTNPGTILLREVKNYIKNQQMRSLNKPKKDTGFRSRPEDIYVTKKKKKKGDLPQEYSEEEIQRATNNLYNPHTTRFNNDGELRRQEI